MFSISGILITTFVSGLVAFVLHHTLPKLRDWFSIVALAFVGYAVWILPVNNTPVTFRLANFNIVWGNTDYGRLFALIVAVLSFFAVLYSKEFMRDKAKLGYYYLSFFFAVGGMLGIVFSQDLISLFFFWEIMTWSSFLLVIYCCKEAQPAGIKYFIFSGIGAYAILTAIVLVYSYLHSVEFSALFTNFYTNNNNIPLGMKITIVVLFITGFAVKSATMPLHVWAPGAYKFSPSSFTAIFSGALSKMGIFGIGLTLFKLAAETGFYPYVKEILAWIGGLTALFATFYAVFSTDGKTLLAYSSIGQLGYIVTGLAIGTPLSIAAALFLTVLHAIFKGMLFLSVGAVYYRTGTTDMNKVSGLIRKMPYTFLTALFGIITVAGVPPLAGFSGKWMLYESLIQSKHYFLVIVLFFASTASFLYLYRFIFSFFLGQEEKETENVKEVPWSMRIPMLLLALMTLVFGVAPGWLLNPISKAMHYLGNFGFRYESTALFNKWGNTVNTYNVATVIGIIFVIVAVIITIKNYRTTRYVTTKDIHTSGEVPTENENLTYAVDFYKPFERALGDVLKASVDKIYNFTGKILEQSFDYLRYVYTGNGQTYAMYVMIFLTILIVFSEMIFGIKLY